MKKATRIKRVYYHYEKLEEYHAGMWRIVRGDERKQHIQNAGDLMRNSERFSAAMRQAIKDWPLSCEHSLSAEATNRIAWLGHAGCCVGVGSPEESTRAGWHTLSPPEQDAANAAAGIVLYEWEQSKVAALLHTELDQPDLFRWAMTNAKETNRNLGTGGGETTNILDV